MPRVRKIKAGQRIQDLTERIWTEYIEKHELKSSRVSSPPTVLLSRKSRNVMGYAHYQSNTITLFCYTDKGLYEHEWFETLLHEVAHHLAPRRANHGREFLKIVAELEHEWYPEHHGRWGWPDVSD